MADLEVFDNIGDLETFIQAQKWSNKNLIMMSSGNFDNMDINALGTHII